MVRFALAAWAVGGGAHLAKAGSSDWDSWSLISPPTPKALDSRLRAQAPEQPGVEQHAQEAPPTRQAAFGVLSGAWDSKNFLGEIGGLRTTLDSAGISLNITENAELFGNVTGGARQSFSGNGLTTMTLQLDTKKGFGFDGGTFNVSGLHIGGGNLTETNLLTLQTLTGIEADRSLRLWELWYDQKFGDKFDVKLGAQSIDQEFMTSISAAYFINSAMGWGALPEAALDRGHVIVSALESLIAPDCHNQAMICAEGARLTAITSILSDRRRRPSGKVSWTILTTVFSQEDALVDAVSRNGVSPFGRRRRGLIGRDRAALGAGLRWRRGGRGRRAS